MKILLFGKNGQVGWELQRSLVPLGEVVALDIMDHAHCGDLTDQVGIARTLQAIQPDIIINAAAYTAVDKAESESDLAYRINAEGPGLLAQQARRLGAWLIHYSTDYVFDGKGKRPWTEADPTSPVNVYGLSKRQGEVLIQQADCKHIILRTSWVYAAQGQNFAKTILRLARERTQLTVIDDQIGAPTGAELMGGVTGHCGPRGGEKPAL